MAMFRDFSFNPASRHPSHLDIGPDEIMAPTILSPTSNPLTISQYPLRAQYNPIHELSERFGNHHISEYDLPSSYFGCLGSPEDTIEMSMEPPISPLTNSHPASTSPLQARRLQRQNTSRLQCTPAHLARLSSLLETVISQEDQCYYSRPSSISTMTTRSSVSSDAGYTDSTCPEGDTLSRGSSDCALAQLSPSLPFRRSGDPSKRGACVMKNVRIRKRSAERILRRSR